VTAYPVRVYYQYLANTYGHLQFEDIVGLTETATDGPGTRYPTWETMSLIDFTKP
jgi:hypothetical protein